MVPTTRAEKLAKNLPILLEQVERTLEAPELFDPATAIRGFRLVAPDFISPLLPHLLKAVEREAPGVNVEIAAFSPTAGLDTLQGRFDALIAPSFKQTDDLRGVELGSWPWVTFGKKDHPGFADWSLQNWARYTHLQVSASSPSGRSPIDRTASEFGVARKIGAVVPHFSMTPPILRETEMLLTVPSVAMHAAAAVYGLEQRDLPFELPSLKLSLFHSAKNGDDPEIRWFRKHIADAAQVLSN